MAALKPSSWVPPSTVSMVFAKVFRTVPYLAVQVRAMSKEMPRDLSSAFRAITSGKRGEAEAEVQR